MLAMGIARMHLDAMDYFGMRCQTFDWNFSVFEVVGD